MLVCLLSVVTPIWTTSAGRSPCAMDTRFCTFIAAMSGSVPCSKYTVMEPEPELVAVELMYIMFSTPLMLSSSGTITLFMTASASAPG